MTTGMERLRFMLGEWTIEAHVMNEIEEWETISLPTETTILPMLGGACHHEIMPVCFDGTITHFFFSWSYDPYRHIYRMISCTDSDGLMAVMEGDFIDTNTVVISDVNTGTAILNSDRQPAFFRQLASTKNDANSFTDIVSESYDGGHSWLPVFRAIHTRKL